jgi:hypothetical protein
VAFLHFWLKPDIRSNTALDDTQLRAAAPSVFAETAHDSRSEK